ncbi:hypothetical protein Anas_04233 [Armadillidium nasatum]|uniref:Secreted protein n=1 Tax=Armadillidium nasatum TaxID=96803 RepID=A0A5N5SWM1_9CRUS|nr:hypothetical protein Anas_04233 [Armadillidium nasatum]
MLNLAFYCIFKLVLAFFHLGRLGGATSRVGNQCSQEMDIPITQINDYHNHYQYCCYHHIYQNHDYTQNQKKK